MAPLIRVLIEERVSEMEVLSIICIILLLMVVFSSSSLQAKRTLSPAQASDQRMPQGEKNAYAHPEFCKPFLSPLDVKSKFPLNQDAMVREKAQEAGKLASNVNCFRLILPTCLDGYMSNILSMLMSKHTSSLFTPVAASFSTAFATGNPSTTSATRFRVP
jgi:hypothetical protein